MSEIPGRHKIRVLILEDRENDAELILAELSRAGFDPEWRRAQSESEFLALLPAMPDVILADYHLPQFDAPAALRLLHQRKLEIPFIVVSGSIGEEAAVEAIKQGADDYLLKDRLARLGMAVSLALEKQRLRATNRRTERGLKTFSELGRKLGAARSAVEAGEIIVAAADELLGWDAFLLDLYSPEKDRIHHVLCRDLIEGERVDCPPAYHDAEPSPLTRRVIDHGAQLIQREAAGALPPSGIPFGNTSRTSASLMFVPIREGAKVIGILSIQSYLPMAYNQSDLDVLQSLADHCGGALHRIRSAELQRDLEEQLRHAQKMEAIGRLAGGVAHDFNNILTVIQGYAQFLQMDQKLESSAQGELNEILMAVERASGLTRQLLSFSRKQVPQPRNVNLNEILASVASMLRRIIGADVALRRQPAETNPLVFADAGMMEQVLMNLAVNARDAMPQGGELAIRVYATKVDEAHACKHPQARPGDFVCLSVKDSGVGMTPDVAARIFEPFFTTKSPGKGTGLGLATVQGIVQQHDGWIEVESAVGQGTTFRIYLPQVRGTATEIVGQPALPPAQGGTETILLVEDESGVREMAALILRRQGYQVLEAGSGVSALAVWHRQADEINLVITDLVMPDGLTGTDLVEKLLPSRPELKVIYTSGYCMEVAGNRFPLVDGINFLPKPYRPQNLVKIVRDRLDGTGESVTSPSRILPTTP